MEGIRQLSEVIDRPMGIHNRYHIDSARRINRRSSGRRKNHGSDQTSLLVDHDDERYYGIREMLQGLPTPERAEREKSTETSVTTVGIATKIQRESSRGSDGPTEIVHRKQIYLGDVG